jgi:hypothetical protein
MKTHTGLESLAFVALASYELSKPACRHEARAVRLLSTFQLQSTSER